MHCYACGAPMEGAFCGTCGAQQPAPQQSQQGWANDSGGWANDSTVLTPQRPAQQPEFASSGGSAQGPSNLNLIIAIAVAAVLVAGAAVAYLVLRSEDSPTAQQTHTATVTASPGGSPAETPTDTESTEPTPWDSSGVGDAPGIASANVTVVRDQQHDECRPTGSTTAGYPTANCRVFVETAGRATGTSVPKTQLEIACQRDFPGSPNPVYRANQHNTYWVWATYAGQWDWFPETSLAEGGSGLPLGQVALCD